jgi:hypothetical protein
LFWEASNLFSVPARGRPQPENRAQRLGARLIPTRAESAAAVGRAAHRRRGRAGVAVAERPLTAAAEAFDRAGVESYRRVPARTDTGTAPRFAARMVALLSPGTRVRRWRRSPWR